MEAPREMAVERQQARGDRQARGGLACSAAAGSRVCVRNGSAAARHMAIVVAGEAWCKKVERRVQCKCGRRLKGTAGVVAGDSL